MTRKDYELIARAIKASMDGARYRGSDTERNAIREVAKNIAGALQADNPRFDWARFLSACGLD